MLKRKFDEIFIYKYKCMSIEEIKLLIIVSTGGTILFGDLPVVHPKLVPSILTQKQ